MGTSVERHIIDGKLAHSTDRMGTAVTRETVRMARPELVPELVAPAFQEYREEYAYC